MGRHYYLPALFLFCSIGLFFSHSQAQAQTAPIIERSVVNADIGYELRLPEDWQDLNPLLVGLYNLQADVFSSGDTLPTAMTAGFNKTGNAPLPPILVFLFARAPEGITRQDIAAYNQTFLNEARDIQSKAALARQTGLVTDVGFDGYDELRPNTPIFINTVTTTMDFSGKLMSIPFYTKDGILTLFFFAENSEFAALSPEVLSIARELIIFADKRP